MMVETGLSRSIRLMFIGSIAFGMHMANAQTTGENIQKVEVTGSSIKRAEAETISVIQTLTRKDIEQTGKASIADVVRSISADNNGSISGSFTNGFAGSASGVSLRGLSVSSTLVLINGRRTAPYGFGDDGQRSFVDLNSIPLDAVDRID
ncbi:MAG: TonB-dependent receptor plug domain-containing protein, partial [Janthinobacterium sp.]